MAKDKGNDKKSTGKAKAAKSKKANKLSSFTLTISVNDLMKALNDACDDVEEVKKTLRQQLTDAPRDSNNLIRLKDLKKALSHPSWEMGRSSEILSASARLGTGHAVIQMQSDDLKTQADPGGIPLTSADIAKLFNF